MSRTLGWVGGIALASIAAFILANVFFSIPDAEAVVGIPIQHVRDPQGAILGIANGGCVSEATIDRQTPDLTMVDARISLAPWAHGWVADLGVFYGTLEEVVHALGGTEIATGPNGIWFKTSPTTAESIWALRTPLGRTVWMPKDSMELTTC